MKMMDVVQPIMTQLTEIDNAIMSGRKIEMEVWECKKALIKLATGYTCEPLGRSDNG